MTAVRTAVVAIAALVMACGSDGSSPDARGGDDAAIDAPSSDAPLDGALVLANLQLADLVATGFTATVDASGDANANAAVTLRVCGGTLAAPCDPASGASVTMTRAGAVYQASVDASSLPSTPFSRVYVAIEATDPDGVTGLPLVAFADLPVLALALGDIVFTEATETGFTATVEFFGDADANATVRLSYCNLWNTIYCNPTGATVMTRGSAAFELNVSGLTSPNDPFEPLLVRIDATDPGGVAGSGATDIVWLVPAGTLPITLTELGSTRHLPGGGFTVYAGYYGDTNANASVMLRFCNLRLDPTCDPAGAPPIGMTRGDNRFVAAIDPLPAGYMPGDELRLAVAIADGDGTTHTSLYGRTTIGLASVDAPFIQGWWGTSCQSLGAGLYIRALTRFDRGNFSGTGWLYTSTGCAGAPTIGISSGSFTLPGSSDFVMNAFEIDSDGYGATTAERRYDIVSPRSSYLYFGESPGSSPATRPTELSLMPHWEIKDGSERPAPPSWTPPDDLLLANGSTSSWFGAGLAVVGTTAYVASGSSTPLQKFAYDAVGARWNWVEDIGVPTCNSNVRPLSIEGLSMAIGCYGGGYQMRRLIGTIWYPATASITSPLLLGEQLGKSVAVSGDLAVIGAPTSPFVSGAGAGAAYILRWNGTQWVEEARVQGSASTLVNSYANAVAVANGVVFVGANRENAIYVYELSGTWTQTARLTGTNDPDELGTNIVATADRVYAGAPQSGFPNRGAVYVFHRPTGSPMWTEEQRIVPSAEFDNNRFGQSVAVSGDAMIVGASGSGYAYFFARSGTTWTQSGTPFRSAYSADDAGMGRAVAIDGPWAMASAPDLYSRGGVYVYEYTGGMWTGP